ncbi:LysR substrate-binding domain-containing protein [Pelomonas sp. KK5]|uniref:LysR substrate-binding domain-containing protein n=1 Tax=Pelomonas sp. KK5 TaxID=1855730 RepID=UPI0009FB26FF|nr:LysR substrate-binding domain-containing protein [Pelomonas sp. KK5]
MALHRIDPYDLRLFAAVAEAGTITGGAAAMHLSLASASVRLQKLERASGSMLLLRSKRGVALTDAGRTLLRHAGLMQRQLAALHADMGAHARGLSATLRLAGNTAAVSEHLPPRLGPFLAAHPQLDVELSELPSTEALQALRQGRVELAVVADHVGLDDAVAARDFGIDRLVALLPARGAGPARSTDFAALLDRPFVGLPPEAGLSRFLQRRALDHGRNLHQRLGVRSFDAVARLVAEGVGVAVMPEAAALRWPDPRLRLRPLRDAWATRRLLLCWSGEPTAGAALLRDALLA